MCVSSLHLPANAEAVRGYIRSVPSESDSARVLRHQRVAERLKGPIVLVHRGANSFAPENTLEAYAAAMDYGADGCEVDIRRTADGVLVLFHDDMLDQLTNGFGTVSQLTYYELLSLKPRHIYGTASPQTRPPTFASLLTLARQRAMLLFLDIKEQGLDEEVARILDETDMWDHIVAVNMDTCKALVKDPRLKLLSFKAPGLYETRQDTDPESVRAALAKPGQMIILDDSRVAARELKRPPYKPVPLPDDIYETYKSNQVPRNSDELIPVQYLKKLASQVDPNSVFQLTALLNSDLAERNKPDGSESYQRRRTEHIIARAWAAQRLGELGDRSQSVIKALEQTVRKRSLHREWIYHGLDGSMAVRALGTLKSRESVPLLIEVFNSTDPELQKIADPLFKKYPLSWTDFRIKTSIIFALGEMKTNQSKRFLQDYTRLDEDKARELAFLMYAEATKALLKHDLTQKEIESLLQHPRLDVRGTALLDCLDHPSKLKNQALKRAVPWALELPRAMN